MGLEPARAVIDLSQLVKNIKVVRNKIGNQVKLLFVVKGDGYGHGAVKMAQTAEETSVDYLGVDNVAEAKVLRDAGIKLPILIMGPSQKKDLEELVRLNVTITVSDIDFAQALDREARSQHVRVRVQIEVDTGMGRTGILPEEVVAFFKDIQRLPHLEVEGIFTHCSVAHSVDPADKEYTLKQIEKFERVLERLDAVHKLPSLRHIANSAALVKYFKKVTKGYFNMVRIGGLIYGHYTELQRGWAREIKPIMSLVTNIAAIREIPAGSYIGYNRTYKTTSTRKIAILPIGYGHGLDQRLSNCGKVMIKSKEAPIIGLVSMGETVVDVTEIDGVGVGDEVVVIGPNLPVNLMAQHVGIFSSAMLVSILPRVKRVYVYKASSYEEN